MPIFDYYCENCNTRKEVLVLRSDSTVYCHRCPGNVWMKREMPAVGLLKTNFHDAPSVKSRDR